MKIVESILDIFPHKTITPIWLLWISNDLYLCWGAGKYKLFPGAKCGPGFQPITSSWQDCERAGKAIGLTGDTVAHVKYNYPWGTSRPQGCFQSDGNNRIHFNRGAGGRAQGTDKILCQKVGGNKQYRN